jgi:hypothetical protein
MPYSNDPAAWQNFLNIRNRVATTLSLSALVSLLIRLAYVYAAVSLIVGIGGGFYVLGLVLMVTLGRTMASCWALLTSLEIAPPTSEGP